jgi:hypothetical protein
MVGLAAKEMDPGTGIGYCGSMNSPDLNDPIWHTPIRSKPVLSIMEAIRDHHLNLRDEGNVVWKQQVEAENPDVELMMTLKTTLENHGLYAALASRRIAEYHGSRYEARNRAAS